MKWLTRTTYIWRHDNIHSFKIIRLTSGVSFLITECHIAFNCEYTHWEPYKYTFKHKDNVNVPYCLWKQIYNWMKHSVLYSELMFMPRAVWYMQTDQIVAIYIIECSYTRLNGDDKWKDETAPESGRIKTEVLGVASTDYGWLWAIYAGTCLQHKCDWRIPLVNVFGRYLMLQGLLISYISIHATSITKWKVTIPMNLYLYMSANDSFLRAMVTLRELWQPLKQGIEVMFES